MKKYTSTRWILFSIVLVIIFGISLLNVFYLYKLQDNSKSILLEKRKSEISEFISDIRNQFVSLPFSIWKIDLDKLYYSVCEKKALTDEFIHLVDSVSSKPLYTDIYFTFPGPITQNDDSVQIYNRESSSFQYAETIPEVFTDGINLTKAQVKVLIEDYRWNTKTIFDTHRSMNIAIVHKEKREIIGYLSLLINTEYLVNQLLEPKLVNAFGNDSTSSTIWVFDWVKRQVITTNNKKVTFNRDKIDYFDKFPSMFDNWSIYASVNTPVTIASINDELTRNIIVLALALIITLGSIIYILITAQKEREFAMRQSAFLSNVTHELKTPLAVIQAAGENLKDGRVKDPSRLTNYGQHIYDESQRLKKMIDKLLDAARSDVNKTSVKASPFNIEAYITNWIDEHTSYFNSKGFTIRTTIENDQALVLLDNDHFETIISNLIDNAIKYSNGSKEIFISTYNRDKKKVIEIKDNGIGIPPNALPHIFDKFYRVEDTLTAQTKGHGLGLSIVKGLVEANGGEIFVSSEYKSGSVFTLKFPIFVNTGNAISQHSQKTEDNKEYVIQG